MRQFRRAFSALPASMRTGIAVFLVGAGLDLVYHAPFPFGQASLDAYLGERGFLAHLVTFIGMAVTLFGVVAAGVAQATRRHGPPSSLSTSTQRTFSREKEM